MDMTTDSDANLPHDMPDAKAPMSGVLVRNHGEPIHLVNVDIDCVSAEAARSGETPKVWTRLAITSDDHMFHRIATGLTDIILQRASAAGTPLDIERVKTLLVVIKPDNTAELWADTAAMSLNILVKRPFTAGAPIFARDVVDVVGMTFPAVKIGAADKVICLFRQDWKFALCFNFNHDKNFDLHEFERTLGRLYRSLKYREIYDAIRQIDVYDKLVAAGWFPFAEIVTSEFPELVSHCEAGFDLKDIEDKIVEAFDETRLDHMLQRWLAKPHFASRENVLRSALRSFKANDPVAVIKTVLTEIQGVLNAAHRAAKGNGAKIKTLVKFVAESAERKAGSPQTLLLPEDFKSYLEERTYANFDPIEGNGTASSRHAVGHGEAAADTYTQVAALQALLTLDQIAFST